MIIECFFSKYFTTDWAWNHENFHAIIPFFITPLGVLGFLISRYKSIQERISDYGLASGMLLLGMLFFLHSQDGNGYTKEVHDFWCMLILASGIVRILIANGSKLRFQLGWLLMWSSWVFAIANLSNKFESKTRYEASNACALMGAISFFVCAYLAWSGNRVRKLLGKGPAPQHQFELVKDSDVELNCISSILMSDDETKSNT